MADNMIMHAVCIMAHKNVEQLNILLQLLDHPKIDIYLHLDSKSSINPQEDIKLPQYSKLVFVPRHDTRWGVISLVETEMELFRAVYNSGTHYERVHLISGQDLPVKTIDYILEYFEKEENKDKEFISIDDQPNEIQRLKYYWLYTKHMRQGIVYKLVRHGALVVQRIIGVNRLKKLPLRFKYGSEWVSLTYYAVNYIVENWPKYAKYFRKTVCSDELYKQMVLSDGGGQNEFSSKGNLRYAKFVGASPEIIHANMVAGLVDNPDILFARKFDMVIDRDAVEKLINEIEKKALN